MTKLETAQKYIDEYEEDKTNKPVIHFTPKMGFMNDPNGFIYYKDNYHLFYQYNPYDLKPDAVYWGHAISKDLIKFSHEHLALAPDEPYETSCFSGGAININDTLNLIYTSHYEKDNIRHEYQSVAYSKDGINFQKNVNNPLIKNINDQDFRDPYPFFYNGYYYVLIGYSENKKGQILIYRSPDFQTFEYYAKIGPDDIFLEMAECPALVPIKDKWLLIFCATNSNTWLSRYALCDIDIENKVFKILDFNLLDIGPDFYAPQLTNNNEVILIGWMDNWGKEYESKKENYVGAMSIPRTIDIVDGELIQKPLKSVYSYFTSCYIKKEDNSLIHLKNPCIIEINNLNHFIIKINDFQITHSHINGANVNIKNITLIIDKTSIEAFINNGTVCYTKRYYKKMEWLDITANSTYEIKVYQLPTT